MLPFLRFFFKYKQKGKETLSQHLKNTHTQLYYYRVTATTYDPRDSSVLFLLDALEWLFETFVCFFLFVVLDSFSFFDSNYVANKWTKTIPYRT